MINVEPSLPFKWFATKSGSTLERQRAFSKQHQNRRQSRDYLPYKLYGDKNTGLPFQIFLPLSNYTITALTHTIQSWKVVAADSDILAPTILMDVATELAAGGYTIPDAIDIQGIIGVGLNFRYKFNDVTFVNGLPTGYQFHIITLADGKRLISEVMYIPCDDEVTDLLRLRWRHSCDIGNILYANNDYENWLYFNTDLIQNQPSIVEEGFRNGRNEFVTEKVYMVDHYALQEHVPEFVFRAIQFARMHNSVNIDVPFEVWDESAVRIVEAKMTYENNAVDGTMEVDFEQETAVVSRTSCCNELSLGALIQPVAVDDSFDIDGYSAYFAFLNNQYIQDVAIYNLLNNDTGINLIVNQATLPTTAGGSVVMANDGTFKYNPPTSVFAGADSFNYSAYDYYMNPVSATVYLNVIHWACNNMVILKNTGQQGQQSTVFQAGTTWNPHFSVFAPGYIAQLPAHADNTHPQGNDLVVDTTLVYANGGSGNYITIDAQGFMLYYIVNATAANSVGGQSFTIPVLNQYTSVVKYGAITIKKA